MSEKTAKPGRALWKGHLRLSLVTCAIGLYKATSTTEKVSFNTLNRKTGNRLKQLMVDSASGAAVETEDRVKGYEVDKGRYIMVENEELEAIRPKGDKVIDIETCVPAAEIEPAYLDERYFIVPDDRVGEQAFAVVREALAAKRMVGLGKLVLRSRQRPVMVEPAGRGLVATTLRHASEVRSAAHAFENISAVSLPAEMVEIAAALVERKAGSFDPSSFVDAFEEKVIELIRAKQAGKVFAMPAEAAPAPVIDLMATLKAAIAQEGGGVKRKPAASTARARKKAA